MLRGRGGDGWTAEPLPSRPRRAGPGRAAQAAGIRAAEGGKAALCGAARAPLGPPRPLRETRTSSLPCLVLPSSLAAISPTPSSRGASSGRARSRSLVSAWVSRRDRGPLPGLAFLPPQPGLQPESPVSPHLTSGSCADGSGPFPSRRPGEAFPGVPAKPVTFGVRHRAQLAEIGNAKRERS